MRGLFGTLVQQKSAVLDFLPGFLMGSESKTGVSVNWQTALQVSAMLCAARVVAEGMAQSGCRLLKRRASGFGSDHATAHPLYRLLARQPNGWQTAFELIETIAFHLMLVGNAYVYKNRVSGGRIHELIPLMPGQVSVIRLPDMTLQYRVSFDNGQARTIPASDMWHLRGPSWNSWMGMESVKLARDVLGLSISLEEGHAAMHKSGAQPGGVYSIEGNLTAEKHAELTKWLKEGFSAAKRGTPMVLDRGAKWLAQQMTGVDSEHLATRRFQIEEVCRAVRVMPIMVMQQDKAATFASSEQMFLQHIVHTLDPWTTRIAQSADVALLTEKEIDEGYFFEFNLTALMRGDYKSRQEGLQIMRRNGVIHANDWLALERMNPRDDEGGNQYIVEGNMAVQDGRDLVPVSNLKVS